MTLRSNRSAGVPPACGPEARGPLSQWNGGKDFAGAGGVGGDLSFQGVEAREFLFRADKLDQRNAQMPAVKVGVGVEQMRFEARLGGADGRAQADIGDPVDGAAAERVVEAVTANPDGIDPKGRPQIFPEAKIGGREADCPPPAVADHDAPVDLPEAAELGRRVARSAAA